jgi:hypothetical protein
MDAQVAVVAEDVQVVAKPQRRTYTAEYKRQIMQERRRVHDAGSGRGVATARGIVFLASGRVAPRTGAGRAGRSDPEEAGPQANSGRSPRTEDHRARVSG